MILCFFFNELNIHQGFISCKALSQSFQSSCKHFSNLQCLDYPDTMYLPIRGSHTQMCATWGADIEWRISSVLTQPLQPCSENGWWLWLLPWPAVLFWYDIKSIGRWLLWTPGLSGTMEGIWCWQFGGSQPWLQLACMCQYCG